MLRRSFVGFKSDLKIVQKRILPRSARHHPFAFCIAKSITNVLFPPLFYGRAVQVRMSSGSVSIFWRGNTPTHSATNNFTSADVSVRKWSILISWATLRSAGNCRTFLLPHQSIKIKLGALLCSRSVALILDCTKLRKKDKIYIS